jgi:hypothetical protein
MVLNRFFVKILSVPFDNLQSIRWALTKTGSQSVAKFVRNQLGLAVNDFQGTFGTVHNAISAAVTFFFIYFDYLSFYLHVVLTKKDQSRDLTD